MKKRTARRERGFSLVEVCLAVLVVGLGILSIFGLFPTGLAASEDAETDTTAGLFAYQLLTQVQAQADDLKSLAIGTAWERWEKNMFIDPYKTGTVMYEDSNGDKINDVAYILKVVTPPDKKVKQVTLEVLPWKGDKFTSDNDFKKRKLHVFYTELYFTVLP